MPLIDPSVPYCWCPEYTIQRVPQRLMLTWDDNPDAVGTDYYAPNIDDAELVASELNQRLGYEHPDEWREVAAAYIQQTCNGAPILLTPARFEPWDADAADKALQAFLPSYGDITEPLNLFESRPELSENLLRDLANQLEQLKAETDDNIAFQLQHYEELRKNPELWTEQEQEPYPLRLHRARELLRHFRIVSERFAELRNKVTTAYQELTGDELEFAPDFPARPEARAELAGATSPIA